jgi:acyl-CoA synthetase (AMP-forming)/AMP-acid ligase II
VESDRGRWLRTGDLGAVRDGQIFIVGRLKDLLILNGRNVHPADMEAHAEAALAGCGVLRAAATGVAGASSEALLLFLELSREALRRADAPALFAAARTAAAESAEAAPAGVVLLKPGALPLTSSGKLRRGEARDRFLAGALAGVAHMDAGAQRLVALAGEPQAR